MKNVNTMDNEFTGISFHYSSFHDISRSEYYYHMRWLQHEKSRFLNQATTKNSTAGIKCGFFTNKWLSNVDNGIAYVNSIQSTMIGNSIGIGKFFSHRVLNQFDRIYSKKRFVQWYLQEGLEEDEFDVARENVHCLVNEYNSITGDVVNDNDNGDDDNESDNNATTKIPHGTNGGDGISGGGMDGINHGSTPVHLKSNTMGIRWIPPNVRRNQT